MAIDYDDLLDFVQDNGLTEKQTIGTLLDRISDSELPDEDEEEEEEI